MDQPSGYHAIPAVWVYTVDARFNQAPGGLKAFLTPAQQARLERIRQARMLFDGQHRQYYLEERRSQFNFPPALAGDWAIVPYLTVNAAKLVCNKTADLLFGVEPKIDVDDEDQSIALAALRDRSAVDQLLYNTCLECTYEAEAFVEACRFGGEVYLQTIPADEIFPDGRPGPDNQYPRYVRYQLQKVGSDASPIWLLLETWYKVGSIVRRLWQLAENGRRLKTLDLAAWPMEEGETPLSEIDATGLGVNTVTWVYNELNRKRPVSLVDRIISLQDSLNAKQTQVDRILGKHADPKLYASRQAADPATGGLHGDHDVFFGDDKQRDMPEYIPWPADLTAAMASKREVVNLLCITAEVSPSLLGLKEGAAPDAARKLRLEATNTISMVARVGSNWKPGIKRAIAVAQALEGTAPWGAPAAAKPTVQMMDGLPIDTLDQANELATLKGAGLISVERAVSVLIPDKAEADAEVARIEGAAKAAAAAATPSIYLSGEPGAGEGAGGPPEGGTPNAGGGGA